ncbi:MAG TPA: hypothetical protein V6D10_08480 [Trichocoleus sp.]|jgi:3-deoxy-D-manno-octulosonic acid (KDO) 8-phosphate synthase
MAFYFSGAFLTAGLLLNAFLKDNSTAKTDIASWLVLIVATVFWVITLPCILRKQTMLVQEATASKSLIEST